MFSTNGLMKSYVISALSRAYAIIYIYIILSSFAKKNNLRAEHFFLAFYV